MAFHLPVTGNDASAGRLPAPTDVRAFQDEAFDQMTAAWRSCGMWFTEWNHTGVLVRSDHEDSETWRWVGRSAAFIEKLASCAVALIQASEGPQVEAKATYETMADGALHLLCVPALRNRRLVGVVAAVALSTDADEEALTRAAQQWGIPTAEARKWMQNAERIASDQLHRYGELLRFSVNQTTDGERRRDELAILTDNLDDTYEELHLIYEVSHVLGIPQRPHEMLTNVCKQLLEVTRAESVAFVLNGYEFDDIEALVRAAGDEKVLHEHVVCDGANCPSSTDVLEIARCLQPEVDQKSRHLLINRVVDHPKLEWARGWLKHLVAYPLEQDGKQHGTFFTLNCTDKGDYTSVDVQLFRAVADRIAAALHNQHLYDDLADLLMGMLHALVNSVDAKDPYTYGHSERVAYFSRALARAIGLEEIECERVYLSGLLHDIGKIGVPDAVLTKAGRLTDEEFDQLKKHPEVGHRILARVRQIADLVPGVLFHHERVDGRGYPYGLEGKSIPLFGRIICVADSFDAMTSNRTYRAALPLSMAIAEIRRCAGMQFDPELAEAFLSLDIPALFEEATTDAPAGSDVSRMGALRRADPALVVDSPSISIPGEQ